MPTDKDVSEITRKWVRVRTFRECPTHTYEPPTFGIAIDIKCEKGGYDSFYMNWHYSNYDQAQRKVTKIRKFFNPELLTRPAQGQATP